MTVEVILCKNTQAAKRDSLTEQLFSNAHFRAVKVNSWCVKLIKH